MMGICPRCGNTQSVHRAAWRVYRPKCSKCGALLRPDADARSTIASRKSEERKGVVQSVQDALDKGEIEGTK